MPDWPFLVLTVVIWILGGWMLFDLRHDINDARTRIYKEGTDNSERHLEMLGIAAAMDRRVREHTHHLDYSSRVHDHPHDHPHQHEHVQHVHTLVKISEHEDAGMRVVVKRCENCETIFRDRKELANGRTE